jgi:NADH-quinone oxidoreductase subunit J
VSLPAFVQWLAFAAFALIALGGALGMATTMSMFRSGMFLMASFVGAAGLFLLLSADLLALLQVMMYVGGMLVMILFMVLFMPDPGGAMMASMEMNRLERFFTRGIAPMKHMDMEHTDMKDMDMSMATPIKRPAALLALAVAFLLVVLLLARSPWPLSPRLPDARSAELVGRLLMDKYMIAFEGAGLLILIGIFGSVFLARPARHAGLGSRSAPVAVKEPPAPAG